MKAQKKQSNLFVMIINELIKLNKLSLIILFACMLSAFAVLYTTAEVRKAVLTKEQLILEKDVREAEWRNLVIEENVLAESKNIEQKALKLNMHQVDAQNETVIVIKK